MEFFQTEGGRGAWGGGGFFKSGGGGGGGGGGGEVQTKMIMWNFGNLTFSLNL